MQQLPNIVFILSDQQRWDTLGCYGNPHDVTPHLDAMAGEGVRFENTFSCQPVCGPLRSCLQTGKYATETGCWRNDIPLREDEDTLAKYLKAGGYETGYIGKWHLAGTAAENGTIPSGVAPALRGGYEDYWLASDILEFTSHGYGGHMWDGDGRKVVFPENRYRADCLGDYTVDYLRSRTGEQPFFLFLSFIEPHHQNDRDCYEGPEGSKERFKDFKVPGDIEGTRGNWRKEYPDYLGCCAALDTNVGRIRDELDRLGMAENTVVIYTSDHGSHFRTRNSEYKRSCHDASIRVPLVVYGPGFEGGQVRDELVSLIDLPATVLATAGLDVPPSMQGRPLQTLLTGDDANWPEEIFVQISEAETGRAIRSRRWKYSVHVPEDTEWNSHATAEVYTESFLYDLEADPHERNNLVADPGHLAVRAELAQRLRQRMKQAGENSANIVAAEF
jgi:uncharacterized sulfatase